ncbi:hypothetical protein [Sinanaerobacter chloroacetimidivorans]|jgi:predicted amidophosphoribosyltransferase|uniref:Uncharacterized protein n=1 Tax=Sinanaerobacter chloroacetimidivorans TaxID=2818044 RepID=A0A8J8B221_9FIRM|nr:hypothetical protein [Sinanaerobacter chloroacetimidivorans]MBR0596815.1 hypothetical protein [Sinanaerobacter chloroacetimidivorans]
MLRKIKDSNHDAFCFSRKCRTVTCPHCWTDQRADRNFCYRCGIKFMYADENEKVENVSNKESIY